MNERWNMIEEMVKTPWTFRDFEGLSEPDKVIEVVKACQEIYELNEFQCDVLANLVYEYVDEGPGHLPQPEEMSVFAHTIKELTTTREWTKTGIVWNK